MMKHYACTIENGDTYYIVADDETKIIDILAGIIGEEGAQAVRGIVPVSMDDIPENAQHIDTRVWLFSQEPPKQSEHAKTCPKCGLQTNGTFAHCPACNAPMDAVS
jgi:hypothetical protein